VEAFRESGYLSITDVSFDLVRYMNKLLQRETYDLSCNHVAVVETSRGAMAQALTKNEKRSEGEMSTEG
jgi:hypothetical protein